ncbi:MAG: efflux RND transporter periplasmic adaptor subunit [Elainellaceae cyanobacterium]
MSQSQSSNQHNQSPNTTPNRDESPNGNQSSETTTVERDSRFDADQPDGRSPDTLGGSSQEKWIGILLGVLVLLGIGYGAWRWWSASQGSDSQMQAPQGAPVQVASVETATIQETSTFTGTLNAEQSVSIQSERSGRVEDILVQEGQQVSEGTPIVQLGAAREQADIAGARAQVDVAQSALESAQAELEALRAERERAQAELNLRQEQLQRYSQLVEEGAFPQQELDQRQRDLEVGQAELNAVNRQIQAAQARINEARATLRQRRANVTRLRQDVRDTTVFSPFAGVIGNIPIELGDYVEVGQSLTTIVANQTLELLLQIPQERSPDLRIGLPVQVEDAQGNTLGQGRISFISPQINTDSQLILTKATFSNESGQLRDGQFVRAKVIWERTPNQIVVPQTAVIYQGDRRFVYVPERQDDQLTAQQQMIELGAEQGTQVEVLDGLQASDRIITSGTQQLADGAPIRLLENEQNGGQNGQPSQTSSDETGGG